MKVYDKLLFYYHYVIKVNVITFTSGNISITFTSGNISITITSEYISITFTSGNISITSLS